MLTHYTDRMEPVRLQFEGSNFEGALSELNARNFGGATDKLCYLLEEGTIRHTGGDFEGSNNTFFAADEIMQRRYQRAIVSAGKTVEQLGSMLINEKTVAYEGEAFERVLMHGYQALNFLLLGDREAARVEIRKAYDEADRFEDLNRKKLQKLDEELGTDGSAQSPLARSLDKETIMGNFESTIFSDPDYQALESRALSLKNAYQNAFAYYLSSLVYEMNGEPGEAYIDCKTVHQLRPSFVPARADLVRLADESLLKKESAEWQELFKLEDDRKENAGDLVVVFQCGLAVEKKQIKIPIPLPQIGLKFVAFPIYRQMAFAADRVSVSEEGGLLGKTHVLADMDGMAVRNLKDRLPVIALKTAIRFAVRAYAMHEAYEEGGVAGMVAASALDFVLEQADLRSWLLMPSNIQVARIPMERGEHNITLVLHSNTGAAIGERKISVKIETNRITLVNLRGIFDIVGDVNVTSPL
jgi:hypothetical protein